MQIVPYGGWSQCARFTEGSLEVIVTLDVGPRVIRFGFQDGPNELVEYPGAMGLTGGSEYRSYGGHRLWTAPESPERTYEPDNLPVEYSTENGFHIFTTALGATRIRRQMRIRADGPPDRVVLEHRVANLSDQPLEIAPWCLTVMAPGGTCVFPQPEPREHSEALLPAAPLVLWRYTDMADPRWTWGRRLVRLRQDAERGPQKVGARIEQGWAAYANHGNLFVKRFPCLPDALYPDFGCNFETFTRHDMLEVESLGPLVVLLPGQYSDHIETWHLMRNFGISDDDARGSEQLRGLVASLPRY